MTVSITIKKVIVAVLLAVVIGGCVFIGISVNRPPAQTLPEVTDDEPVTEKKLFLSRDYDLTDEELINPYIGFAPQAESEDQVGDNSLVFIGLTFVELEEEKGVFDFDFIYKKYNIDKWKAEGKHAVLRFICDKPGQYEHMDIPQWLYDETGDGTHYDNGYGKGYSPDYNNEIFIEEHAKAIEALGREFGSDGFVAYVELGSLGHWGEWHVDYDSGITRIPTEKIRERYVEPYLNAFPACQILMRRPFSSAAQYGLGLFNDVLGDRQGTDEWLGWIARGGDFRQAEEKNVLYPVQDRWKSSAIGGEFCSDNGTTAVAQELYGKYADMIAECHMSFAGAHCIEADDKKKYCTDEELWDTGVRTLRNSLGYRYGVTHAEFDESIGTNGTGKITLDWVNVGCAPLYFESAVNIYILDAAGNETAVYPVNIDLSQLMPGEKANTSTSVAVPTEGEYSVAVGICDGYSGKPSICLASSQERYNNYSILYSPMSR